jgi:hypothetical protein
MGESANNEAQRFPSALPLWELHSCGSCKCLEPWLERKTSTELGPHDTIRKALKFRCFTCPCIVHLNVICMSYDQRSCRSQIGNLTPYHKSFESMGQMRSDWSVLCTVGNIFSRVIKYYPCTFRIYLIWERYECPKFWDNKESQFWDSHLGVPRKSDI